MKKLLLFFILLNSCSIFSDNIEENKDCGDWYNHYYTDDLDPTKVIKCRVCWTDRNYKVMCVPRGKLTEEEQLKWKTKKEHYDPILKNIQKQNNNITIEIIK